MELASDSITGRTALVTLARRQWAKTVGGKPKQEDETVGHLIEGEAVPDVHSTVKQR